MLHYPHTTAPASDEAIEVAPGVLWLRLPLPFALDHINVWAIADEFDGVEGWTVVDTGYGNDATRALWERHFAQALGGRPVVRVIATHCHPDHIGNVEWVAQRFGCRAWMAQAEFLTAHAMRDERAGHGTQPASEMFSRNGLPDEYLEIVRVRGNTYRLGVPALPTRYRRIVPGGEVSIGARVWRGISGYGHSPEHLALWSRDDGVLISGDMLLPKISTNVSVWPVDPDGDPLRLFLDSIGRFESLPVDTLVLPSHGLPFRGIAPRVAQLRAHHEARLAELLAAASRPVTAWDLVPVLFRRELDAHQRFFALGEAIAHLNHLWHRDVLRRVASADGRWRFAQ